MKKSIYRIGALLLAFTLLMGICPVYAADPPGEEAYTLTITDITHDFQYHNYAGLYVGRTAVYRVNLYRDSDGAVIPSADYTLDCGSDSSIVFIEQSTCGENHIFATGVSEGATDIMLSADVDGDGVADAELAYPVKVTYQTYNEGSYRYEFIKACRFYTEGFQATLYRKSGYNIENITSLAMTTEGDPAEVYPESTIITDPWCYVSSYLGSDGSTATYSSYYTFGSRNSFAGHSRDNYIRFKIYVPEAGAYTPISKHTANKNAAKIDIYLSPVDSDDPEAAEYHLGLLDTGYPNNTVGCPRYDSPDNFNFANYAHSDYYLEPVSLETPGEYYLTYRFNARSMSSQHCGNFKTAGFVLEKIGYKLTVGNPPAVKAGETARTAITLLEGLSDPVDLSAITFEVNVQNAAVAEAEAEISGNNAELVVTGISEGTTAIDIIAKSGGNEIASAQTSVTVIPDLGSYNLTLTEVEFDYHNFPGLYVGRTVVYSIMLIRDSDGAIIPSADYTLDCDSDSSVLYLEQSTRGEYHIFATGIREGTTDIQLSADINGDGAADAELTYPVTVTYQPFSEGSLRYDFIKACSFYTPGNQNNSGKTSGYKLEQITSLAMTTKGNPLEILPDSFIKTDPWCYDSKDLGGGTWVNPNFKYGAQNPFGRHDTNQFIRFKIYVPETGVYTPITKHSANCYAPRVDIFLAPVESDNPEAEKYHLGTVDTGHPADIGCPETDLPDNFNYLNPAHSDYYLEPVSLETTGEYYLTYRWKARGMSGAHSGRFRTTGFILEKTEYRLFAGIPRDIKAGETARAGLTLIHGVSDPAELSGITFETNVHNPGIADAEVEVNGNIAELVVTGISSGTTKIDITAKSGGREIASAQTTATVLPGTGSGPLKNLNYNFLKISKYYTPGNQNSSNYSAGMKVSAVTSLGMTTKGFPSEIYPTSSIKTDPWCYVSSKLGDLGVRETRYQAGSVNDFSAEDGCYMRFKILVPTAGEYTPVTKHTPNATSPVIDVFLAPVNASDPAAEEYKLAQINTYIAWVSCPWNKASPTYNDFTPREYQLPVTQLDAGEYYLTYSYVETKHATAPPSRFCTAGFELIAYTLTAETPAPVKVGKSTSAKLKLILGTSTPVSADEFTFEASVRNSDIASAQIDVIDGQATLMVTGLAEGATMVDVTVKSAGEEITSTAVPVVVPFAAHANKTKYEYNFLKISRYYTPGNNNDAGKTTGIKITDVNSPAMTIPGTAEEIFPDSSIETDYWYFVSTNASATSPHFEYGAYFNFSEQPDAYVRYNIYVPNDGEYTPESFHTENCYSPITDVYLSPANAENPLAPEYKIGQVDPYVPYQICPTKSGSERHNQWAAKGFKLPAVELTSGNYFLTYIIAERYKNIPLRFCTSGFTLEHVDRTAKTLGAKYILPRMKPGESYSTSLSLKYNISREEAEFNPANIGISIRDPEIASATANSAGLIIVTGISPGETIIDAEVTADGETYTAEIPVKVVTEFKNRSSYYTAEKVAAARENIELYDWARKQNDDVIKKAEKYIGKEEILWQSVTTQELPRCVQVGFPSDPGYAKCRYCGVDITAKTGVRLNAWTTNALTQPWKVQCPLCKRRFPSNDFGGFYKLGLDENNVWSYELAKKRNAELVAGGQDGYLKNILYPEKGEGWGVDDGYGYVTGNRFEDNAKEVHTYIAYYNHWAIWYNGLIEDALSSLAEAYVFTGEAKYGRVGAILVDRIADVYPDMNVLPYIRYFVATESFYMRGKAVDYIWENSNVKFMTRAYDAFFPMYDDPYVVNFLSQKAEKYKLPNPKTNSRYIRENCEDGILREVYKSVRNGDVNGNFGMYQTSVAYAAVALDTFPETAEWLDWIFKAGAMLGSPYYDVTGGNVLNEIVDNVDRDGMTIEISPNYSAIWSNSLSSLLEALAGYDKYPAADLYNNPKYIKMIDSLMPLTLSRRPTVPLGDSGTVANVGNYTSVSTLVNAYKYTKKPVYAQSIYHLNNKNTDGLRYDIYTKNPESLGPDIERVVREYGEYDFDKSLQLGGFGFSILRDGSLYETAGGKKDNQRCFWMFYGNTTHPRGYHSHYDVLNLGINAYGIDVAPDLGYPRSTQGDDYYNWGKNTVQHNTVLINKKRQITKNDIVTDTGLGTGRTDHFDDSGRIKIMEASAPFIYDEAEEYRRTVVMVNATYEDSYGVDFFRVKGGDEHLFAFHALSDTIYETPGLTFVKQADENGNYIGSYAGENVEYETANITNGFSYLKNVDRAKNPESKKLEVDFKITDFRRIGAYGLDLHLRLTMLNDFNLSELAIADGAPPPQSNNPKLLKFMLAKREGVNLDTTFVTIMEPYNKNRYIRDIERVAVRRADGAPIGEGEIVHAVRVRLKEEGLPESGRVDYIVYAEDNTVEYIIEDGGEDVFSMRGFVGVYSKRNGSCVYAYVNDGNKIGGISGIPAYTGRVVDFTRDLSFNNTMTVEFDQPFEPERLIGKHINVDNPVLGNGSYCIENVLSVDGNTAVLDMGDVTFVRGFVNPEDVSEGYTHNISTGSGFRIPLSTIYNPAPVFTPISDKSVDALSQIRFTVEVESPLGKQVTISGRDIPRGASFDSDTRTFTWVPEQNQVGKHLVEFLADDGSLTTVERLYIEVHGATAGPGKPKSNTPQPDTNGPGGGPGGDNGGKGQNGGQVDTNPLPPPPPITTGRFTDLINHPWASEAIEELAEKGIIKGRTENTYAPGDNISRADFAILFVRALKLSSDNTENFSDVPEGAYYASELATARNSGIVTGVGGNRYNPTLSITREDMMVIAVRALEVAGLIQPSEPDELNFDDAADISPYAYNAVSRLVSLGLITGSNGKINPKGYTTRAEVAVLLHRIISLYNL